MLVFQIDFVWTCDYVLVSTIDFWKLFEKTLTRTKRK